MLREKKKLFLLDLSKTIKLTQYLKEEGKKKKR